LLLKGETGLITGSTQGIGRATALRMAAEGANVIVSGRNADRGEAVVAEIRAAGGQAAFVRCDVGVEEDVCAAVGAAVDRFAHAARQ
jgi:NAD(P)-dependent dehydrogenase (short-subunit alcohol dehydrogenase family)